MQYDVFGLPVVSCVRVSNSKKYAKASSPPVPTSDSKAVFFYDERTRTTEITKSQETLAGAAAAASNKTKQDEEGVK